jgi:hypothetical protein
MLPGMQDLDGVKAYLRLDELKRYLDITEQYLQKAKEDFKAWADEEVKKLPLQQREEFYDFYSDDYWRHEERFPRILRNSFLVSALSLLEYEIHVICTRLKKERPITISLSDLKGDTLEKTKLFFQTAGLNLKYDGQIWQEINKYYLVRNCIVHNSGLIKGFKDERKLRAYITQKGTISHDTIEEEIALTGQFCEEVIDTMQGFTEELYKTLTEKKPSNKAV